MSQQRSCGEILRAFRGALQKTLRMLFWFFYFFAKREVVVCCLLLPSRYFSLYFDDMLLKEARKEEINNFNVADGRFVGSIGVWVRTTKTHQTFFLLLRIIYKEEELDIHDINKKKERFVVRETISLLRWRTSKTSSRDSFFADYGTDGWCRGNSSQHKELYI